MKPGRDAGKNGASFGAGFVTDCDYIGKGFSRLVNVEGCFGLIVGNINSNLLHCLDNDRIEPAGFEAGAVGFKFIAANLI